VLNFDHALQNIQNDCHQWLSHSFRVPQIHFRSGLCPGPRWGSLQRSPRSPSWFNGDLLLRGRGARGGDGGEGKKRGGEEGGEGKEREGEGGGEGTAPLSGGASYRQGRA